MMQLFPKIVNICFYMIINQHEILHQNHQQKTVQKSYCFHLHFFIDYYTRSRKPTV